MSDVECLSWFRSSGFQSVVSPGSQKSCGCVILFHPSLLLVDFSSDDAGRFVSGEFCLQDKSFRVISLYAPNHNPARDQFLEQISSCVDPSVPTVLCGDFNTVFDRSLDRAGPDASIVEQPRAVLFNPRVRKGLTTDSCRTSPTD